METIVGVHRNHYGDIISFVTSEGRVISYQKAIVETESGLLDGVLKQDDVDGHIMLTPSHDGNFDHYPTLF
ncbi:DUF3892 domain-containing protein [Neobacillus dielmonensis]|uniref:DUF3892 domain-containing protein n=1 Tax=Neobacillus dielmonensis TaxID=1347369 RepID=UPI0006939384|nr:DUF3892 domain-containing protein [Neobacillus dielmonensis]